MYKTNGGPSESLISQSNGFHYCHGSEQSFSTRYRLNLNFSEYKKSSLFNIDYFPICIPNQKYEKQPSTKIQR